MAVAESMNIDKVNTPETPISSTPLAQQLSPLKKLYKPNIIIFWVIFW